MRVNLQIALQFLIGFWGNDRIFFKTIAISENRIVFLKKRLRNAKLRSFFPGNDRNFKSQDRVFQKTIVKCKTTRDLGSFMIQRLWNAAQLTAPVQAGGDVRCLSEHTGSHPGPGVRREFVGVND